nr:MAG TPA: hypothetical protein [Caudoviricetes sp.]
MTNPAHQSHKVSGVYHIYDCFGFAGLAPAFSTMQTGIPPCGGMNAFVAPERRAFTEDSSAVHRQTLHV